YFNILPHGVSAASALTSQPGVTTNDNQDVQHVPDLDYNVDHSMYLRTFTSFALRDGADGAYDQSNQELSPEPSSYLPRGWRDSSSYSRPYAVSKETMIAQTICDSNTVQVLGPGWGSTFMSNSQDGNYPSGNRTCIWTIQASTNATGGGGSATPSV
ncbi:hypothetical protein BGZ80_007254, partial [Entomortierella chlamydospora]